MASTIRSHFLQELDHLERETLTLGEMVAGALTEAARLLRAGDLEAAHRLIAWDKQVNRRRYATEEQALLVIATQQPVARDIRYVAAALDVVGELERVGDYAKGIASITLQLPEPLPPASLVLLDRMAAEAAAMLRESLAAFSQRDVLAARAIAARDDTVDADFRALFRQVMDWPREPETVLEMANFALWAGHNLERAADRVTNICERIVFTETGRWDWE
ncbi:MAG TPA: phosphate signaling complex protein PhoU [Anaerolineae bacterium]|jgi:phosphate transport system protein|nr:phosphate signaling complex protein PhoU [Ardenticatenia bacterium]MBK8538557.1 phosphate signaling complex protein PhoU [Ardenticatenia bacterium]HQZ71400.1 phosphate signaling complex protein PhoU [Anaerolineae bacterium]HRA19376.1 phosphate signaling complex protein PhoU [Anaerolineae bacterium]